MKLSKREAILLSVLLICALLFLEYQLIYIPGMERYNQLVVDDQKVQVKVDETNRLISSMPSITAKKEKALSDISSVGKPFFDQLNMDALLWNTHDLLTKSGLVLNSYTISPKTVDSILVSTNQLPALTYQLKTLANKYAQASAGSTQTTPAPSTGKAAPVTGIKSNEAEVFTISVFFSGNYDQVRNFISSFELLNKTIVVAALSMGKKDFEGNVEAEIMINYYGVQKIVAVSDLSNTWQLPAYVGGAGNPFIQNSMMPLPNPTLTPKKP